MKEILNALISSHPYIVNLIIGIVIVIILAFIIMSFLALLTGKKIEITWKNINIKVTPPLSTEANNTESLVFLPGYPQSQNDEFFKEVKKLIPKSKEIILIGTALNLIGQKPILDLLIKSCKDGRLKVTICLANPLNPQVESRLIEEKMGLDKIEPRVRQWMLAQIEKLVLVEIAAASEPNFKNNFSVKLFNHYPTFAFLMFDRDIFIYNYVYKKLGNDSPIIHLKDRESEEANFFVSNAYDIINDAFPAEDLVTKKESDQPWIAAAVYIIPPQTSPFYKFGSKILGYDIHQKIFGYDINLEPQQRSFPRRLRKSVEEAREYGFHATIADAMFLATEADLKRIQAELSLLAEDFSAFTLSNLRLADRTSNEGDIVMLCDDESGVTEALHHELVSRFYRLAISSNYLTGRTKKKITSKERSQLMIRKYGAPYILKEFNLHFTLCSKPPDDSDERNSLLEQLRTDFENEVSTNQVKINEICLLLRNDQAKRWEITEKYPLGQTN